MKSKCPYCGCLNDSHQDRKNRFKISDLFGTYNPFTDTEISEFKVMLCGNCKKEYSEKNLTVFGIPAKFSWVLPIIVFVLFVYMIYVGCKHGN